MPGGGGGLGFVHINYPAGGGLESCQNPRKLLIPTQNRFFSIHREYETEFVFSFKNREVCNSVL